MSEKTTPAKNTGRPDEKILLDLNFVPKWAKKAPSENHYHAPMERSERSGRRGGPHRDRRDGPPRSDRRPPRRDGDRPPRRDDARAPRREFHPRPAKVDLPVIIKFLPEQTRLASLVCQIHHSKRAYPLIDLAHIFLSDPRGHMVKLEVAPDAGAFTLYQGKRSKMVATDRDVLLHQLLEEHMGDFFVKEELETEPPTGVFPMIGKIDDILIGPPNHHSYAERLAEIHRARYDGVDFDRFKQRVQTVRDEELIEQWKKESSQKTIYRLKEGDTDKEFSLVQAEDYVRNHIADAEIEEVSRAVLPSSLARKIKDYNLIRMVREAWQQESRFPISVAFALRAAFRHLHLHTFKAGKNINFITAVKPDPIAPDATVETIRLVLEFLADHPGSTRQQLVEGLRPGAGKDSAEANEILKPIRWLVEKGHIIEFFNGTLSVPSRRKRR
jgi:hypothetical protein